MNPSYSNCVFKLHLPKCTVFEEHLKISYKFEYRKENTEKLMFFGSYVLKAELKKWNDEYIDESVTAKNESAPSAEQLAMIEEFKKKGWV